MGLKHNKYYWNYSLRNPESATDFYYTFDKIIITDENFIRKVERLRDLITTYCVLSNRNLKNKLEILDEICGIVFNEKNIQYSEFIAFWKVVDISYSSFMKLSDRKSILKELLDKYCIKRRNLYEKLGYSNTTVQALYDSGSSRKKGMVGIRKLIDIIKKKAANAKHTSRMSEFEKCTVAYFLPDKGDKELFNEFRKTYNIKYIFGKDHQGKEPDMILKIGKHIFIIEAKHIKESGGAQDKQIVETIEFIRHSEKNKKFSIHYLSFMDGIYFNNFIHYSENSKIDEQKKSIEKYLSENRRNFFVNTAGFMELIENLKK